MTPPTHSIRFTGISFTERDLELLRFIWFCGLASRRQIQTAFNWACVSDVNRRMTQLVKAGLLFRRTDAYLPGAMSVYSLGARSVPLLSETDKLDTDRLNRRRVRYQRLSTTLLRHELLLAEFNAQLRSTLNGPSSSEILDWRHADDLEALCNNSGDIGEVVLRPDAYVSFHVEQIRFNCFIEADCGTESMGRIQKKINMYRHFATSGLLQDRFKRSAFRLLFIATTSARAKSLIKQALGVEEFKTLVIHKEWLNVRMFANPVWYKSNDTIGRFDDRIGTDDGVPSS